MPDRRMQVRRVNQVQMRLFEANRHGGLPAPLLRAAADAALAWLAGKTEQEWIELAPLAATDLDGLRREGLWPWTDQIHPGDGPSRGPKADLNRYRGHKGSGVEPSKQAGA